MRVIDVDHKLSYLHLAQADRLAPEPVAVVDLVCVTIEREAILQGLNDRELGEYTQTAPKQTTKSNQTKVIYTPHISH